ncbi:hypothetical protein NE865_12685 [Phthorimaea operculella]|nr:hypothetical protein NE865_12685 [Phthorimaea operculella]
MKKSKCRNRYTSASGRPSANTRASGGSVIRLRTIRLLKDSLPQQHAIPSLEAELANAQGGNKTKSKPETYAQEALDTKTTGAKVDKVRKARNQKVVLSCSNNDDLNLVKSRVSLNKNLKAEVAKAGNPLVIIRDVISYHTDAEIVENLLSQNKHLLHGVNLKETTEKIYIGLQRRPIVDHSPLIQCTKCLGFGHTKAICKEKENLCSHCGDAHLWEKCQKRVEGIAPKCKNCSDKRSQADMAHNAFSNECKERQKWDAIARSRISYC